MKEAVKLLRDSGIQLTPQRTAVVESVLESTTHPSADEVFEMARRKCPTVSRATVYNTLNLLVEKQVVRAQILREGTVVFDTNMKKHHHFIDDETGTIHDIPWESLEVRGEQRLDGFDVREYQVILRGRKKRT
ncbi:MAG: transcriptional repressor [Ignavibacteria bacterium]|nr:transcriptional repressor [Ignavibacteria bacterium]